MLASALPVEGKEFGLKVELYLDTIKRLPQETKTALRSAYIFSRKVPREEREDLIQVGKAAGTDTSQLEALLAEIVPEKSAGSKAQPVSGRELKLTIKEPKELVTSPEELERLRTLACPHIRDSLFWEEFISHRVLVCTSCEQPALFTF